MAFREFVVFQVRGINDAWQDYSRCTANAALEYMRGYDPKRFRPTHWISKEILSDHQLNVMAADQGEKYESRPPAGFVVGARESYREEINSDNFSVIRWIRVIGDYEYRFTRVEDANRNAYIDVQLGSETVHSFRGRTDRPKTGIQVLSEEMGKFFRL